MILRAGYIKGQSFLEYTMLVLVVTAALVAMTVYIQRAMHAYVG
jgi:hypothetical protein